jgi:hypothetical protein
MPSPTAAQPPLEFIPPNFNPLILQAIQTLSPVWLPWRLHLKDIQVSHGLQLAKLYQQFQAGQIRLMVAFRHPSTNDPFCLGHLFWHLLPKIAREQGIHLQNPTHFHFIYDRGIPLWAGRWVAGIYSGLGGTPIRRGRLDVAGLRSVRDLFANGQFPLVAAPEGATNGHNEVVAPIEPGIAQFGFWCLEDLQKAGRSQPVVILPLGIQYQFIGQPWLALEKLLQQLEADSGLVPERDAGLSAVELERAMATLQDDVPLTAPQESVLYRRLYALGEHLLRQMEEFYRKFYNRELPTPEVVPDPPEPESFANNQLLATRLQNLLNAALDVAEDYFGTPSKGTVSDRCRRIEQAAWDRIYRDDLKQLAGMAPVQRGLADLIAAEADLRSWHMRLVESFVSVTGQYVREKPTADRFAETLLLVWEMVSRIQGKPAFPRPKLGNQRVLMKIGEPISVSDRQPAYRTNRRQAVADLTQDLQTALESMILPMEKTRDK